MPITRDHDNQVGEDYVITLDPEDPKFYNTWSPASSMHVHSHTL
jgi:hypothetical protein